MEWQQVLNVGFVTGHEKLHRNTNSFWGPEMAPFVYTSSRWGVESSCEGLPDSNIGSSYQPAPTTDSSASGRWIHRGKKRVLQPISPTPSPLLPTCRQPMHPYGGVICHSGIFFAFFRHFSTLFICIFLDFPICFMPIPFYFPRILWPIILFNSCSLILSF